MQRKIKYGSGGENTLKQHVLSKIYEKIRKGRKISYGLPTFLSNIKELEGAAEPKPTPAVMDLHLTPVSKSQKSHLKSLPKQNMSV